MKRIKILNCSVSKYWYADKIGETFALCEEKKHDIRETATESNKCVVVLHKQKEHVVVAADCEFLR